MNVWVCQVRREAFVGGESQRCRHSTTATTSFPLQGCGVMELIGGEPVEWCVEHGSVRADDWDEQPYCWQWSALYNESTSPTTFAIDCQFVSQVRVGP